MSEERYEIPIDHAAGMEIRPSHPPAPAAVTTTRPDKSQPVAKDSFREIVETVVFVIVLVLLLKTFVAEAFVIPTGSMAPTLLGNHLDITCPQCGIHYVVNASNELDDVNAQPVGGCECENCHYRLDARELQKVLGRSP